jgi:NitT/TauT family transport system substrate-binding protein
MKTWTRSTQLAIALITLLLIVTACGSGNNSAANEPVESAAAANTAEKPSLTKLKVGVLKMAALTDPWIAKQEGMFEKNGLDVELVEFKAGGEAVAAQQSGDVDIILSIPGTAFTAIERGFDLKAIFQNETAQMEGPDSGSMQVLKDSPINAVKDLKGKKVAVSALHSQNTVAVQQLVKAAGLSLDDVQLIEMPFPSQADALKSKQVDAVVTVDPYTTQLTTSGVGKVIAWPNVETIPGQPLGAWFAKSGFVEKNPQVIEAFTTSLKEAIDYLLADPARAKQKVAEYTGLDPALVEQMPLIDWNYEVNKQNWQAVVDMMVESGEMEKGHTADEYFADSMKAYITE